MGITKQMDMFNSKLLVYQRLIPSFRTSPFFEQLHTDDLGSAQVSRQASPVPLMGSHPPKLMVKLSLFNSCAICGPMVASICGILWIYNIL